MDTVYKLTLSESLRKARHRQTHAKVQGRLFGALKRGVEGY